jgi:hypothetical protein
MHVSSPLGSINVAGCWVILCQGGVQKTLSQLPSIYNSHKDGFVYQVLNLMSFKTL